MKADAVTRLAGLLLVGVVGPPAGTPVEAVPTIVEVARLRTARAAHTATTLPGGQVLFVGGMANDGGGIASVESFDPITNQIQQLSSLAQPRTSHTATLLADSTVVIAGGYNGDYLRSVELFAASTRRLRRGGQLLEARSGHTATLMPDGRVLLVGGVGAGWTFLRSAELYDPSTGRSENVGALSVPRESHTATLLSDGRVLIVGGHSGRRAAMRVYDSAELYNPQTRRFEAAGTLVTARHKHDAVRLGDGRVLVIGGADRTDRRHYATTEIYQPATKSFVRGPSMQNRRYKIAGTTVVLPNGDVVVTSGARSAEVLRAGSSRFVEVRGRLPAAYRFAAAAPLRGGDVLFAGGYSDDNQNTAGVWRFRP